MTDQITPEEAQEAVNLLLACVDHAIPSDPAIRACGYHGKLAAFIRQSAALLERARAVEADTETCQKCQGNGEIVTNWNLYMEGKDDEAATARCDDCDGEGVVTPERAALNAANQTIAALTAERDALREGHDHWKSIAHDRLISANQLLERARYHEGVAELHRQSADKEYHRVLELEEALKRCQKLMHELTRPDPAVTYNNRTFWAQCVEAETHARTVLKMRD